MQEDPETSIRRRAQQLGLSKSSPNQFLESDPHLFPYKKHLTQELMLTIKNVWNISKSLHNKIPDFASKLFMSDEAHFELNGTVNKQNCRFWGIANPR